MSIFIRKAKDGFVRGSYKYNQNMGSPKCCTYAKAVLFQSICHILDIVVANLKIEIDIKIFVLTTMFPAMHCPLHLER